MVNVLRFLHQVPAKKASTISTDPGSSLKHFVNSNPDNQHFVENRETMNV